MDTIYVPQSQAPALNAAAAGIPISDADRNVGGFTAVPIAGDTPIATSSTTFEWRKRDGIWAPVVPPSGENAAPVALSTAAATAVLAVNLSTIGLAVSTNYSATVKALITLVSSTSSELSGTLDLTCDLRVSVDSAGNVFCGFDATQAPDLSRLVGTVFAGATLALAASTNGFTIMCTRPAGVACTATAEWLANRFRVTGVASDIPQAGTWGTGGFWDADHGVAGTPAAVTSWTSREGTSVLTTSGGTVVTETDALTATTVLRCVGASIMNQVSAPKWGAFGGLSGTAICALQLTTPAIPSGIFVVDLKNSDNMRRVMQCVYTSNTVMAGYQYDGTNVSYAQVSVVGATRKTVVFCLHTDGKVYSIDADGLGLTQIAAPLNIVVDRLELAGSSQVRRFGVKLPATANPLLEAQQLYTRLASMT